VQLEDEQNRRLGYVYRKVTEARGELDSMKECIDQLQDDYSLCQSEQVDVPGALLAADYLQCMSSRVREQQQVVTRCEQRLSEQMRLAEKALQDRKVMDKLREKDAARYRYEEYVTEQRLTDEAARFVYLHHR